MYSIGSFENYVEAKAALQELTRAGIPEDDISCIANAEGAAPAERDGEAEVDISGVGHAVARGQLTQTLQTGHDILGALQQQGVQPERAQVHAENLRRGGALVLVLGDEREIEEATDIMTDHGAINMRQRAQQWRQQGWENFDVHAGPARHEEKNRFLDEEPHKAPRTDQVKKAAKENKPPQASMPLEQPAQPLAALPAPKSSRKSKAESAKPAARKK